MEFIKEYDIKLVKGDTYALAVKFKNISEDLRTAFLTVKENPEDAPIFQKSIGNGITKIDDRDYKNEKTYKFQIQPADTVNLEADFQYLYDIQVTIGNVVKTILGGKFIVTRTITGTQGVTTPELEVEVSDELETDVETTPATKGVEYEQDPVALAKIGDLTTLTTDNKTNLVIAINSNKSNITSQGEQISALQTQTNTNTTNISTNTSDIEELKNANKFVKHYITLTYNSDTGNIREAKIHLYVINNSRETMTIETLRSSVTYLATGYVSNYIDDTFDSKEIVADVSIPSNSTSGLISVGVFSTNTDTSEKHYGLEISNITVQDNFDYMG